MAGRTRRSGDDVDRAIRDAVLEELGDTGYRALTMEAVAERARVSKPVLYRRYPDRARLVIGALGYALDSEDKVHGADLRSDLISWLEGARRRVAAIGQQTYRAILGDADEALMSRVAELAGLYEAELTDVIIRAARERGELGPADISREVLEVPLRLVRDSMIFGSIDAARIAGLVDSVCIPLFLMHSRANRDSSQPSASDA